MFSGQSCYDLSLSVSFLFEAARGDSFTSAFRFLLSLLEYVADKSSAFVDDEGFSSFSRSCNTVFGICDR